MSLNSPNSHRNGAGNLHHGVFNPPVLLYRNGTRGLLGDRATVSYAAVCSVGCGELSSDAARAYRWRPAGQPGLFFFCIVRDQKAGSFSRPVRAT